MKKENPEKSVTTLLEDQTVKQTRFSAWNRMKQTKKQHAKINFVHQKKRVILKKYGGVAQIPCNPNGGSPFLHTADSRVTGLLFTGWVLYYYTRFSLASKKQTAYSSTYPRRVEQSSSLRDTKGSATPPSLFSSLYNMLNTFSLISCTPRGRVDYV